MAKELSEQAPDIAEQVAEVERQREIQRIEWEIEEEKRKQQRERERQENARKNSLDELNLVIEDWARQKNIVNFFNEIEAAVSSLDSIKRKALSNRLGLA